MVTVVCRVNQCLFHSTSGFCRNRLLVINEMGSCKYISSPRLNESIPPYAFDGYKPPEKQEQIEIREEDVYE